MKKVLIGLAVIIGGSVILAPQASAAVPESCTPQRFKVTAYYSPLPDQAFYNMNSYEAEIRMNWRGTHGASWAPVNNGMVAAPKSYAFGTTVVLPRWVGRVEDRWEAIVDAWQRDDAPLDRVDVYAGKWHEWLRRALSFGVQYVDGRVCPEGVYSDSEVGFDYESFPEYDDFFQRMLYVIGMRPWRDDLMVKSLQYFLVYFGYLDESSTTGVYGPQTTAAICQFQQEYLGLSSYHEACGFYGPQTRRALMRRVSQEWITLAQVRNDVEGTNDVVVTQQLADELVVDSTTPLATDTTYLEHLFTRWEFSKYKFARPLVPWEKSKVVRILQRKLQWLGHYRNDRQISGIYDDYTIRSIYWFQKEKGLLDGSESLEVRGYFGPSTRGLINAY